jgi:putative transposase
MTHTDNHRQECDASQEAFEAMLREQLPQAVRTALISVLEAEVDAFIGAVRYERTEQRSEYRNGHYTRGLDPSIGHISDLPVPRTRKGYQTHLFERYQRRRDDPSSS